MGFALDHLRTMAAYPLSVRFICDSRQFPGYQRGNRLPAHESMPQMLPAAFNRARGWISSCESAGISVAAASEEKAASRRSLQFPHGRPLEPAGAERFPIALADIGVPAESPDGIAPFQPAIRFTRIFANGRLMPWRCRRGAGCRAYPTDIEMRETSPARW